MNSKARIETANKLIRQAEVAKWFISLTQVYDYLHKQVTQHRIKDYTVVFSWHDVDRSTGEVCMQIDIVVDNSSFYDLKVWVEGYYTDALDGMTFKNLAELDAYTTTVYKEMMEA